MKKTFLTGSVCLFIAHLCSADLLTSFTDDFSRDSIGDNYSVLEKGVKPYEINESGVLINGGGLQLLVLNTGTLPTDEDYAAGYHFTASIDLFIPADGIQEVPTVGLLINTQDGKNFLALRFRGLSASDARIQLYARENGRESSSDLQDLQSGPLGHLDVEKWYTLKVSSSESGVYQYTFSHQGANTPIISGTFKEDFIWKGVSVGIYSENAPAGAYQFDNFSVTVEKNANEVKGK